MKSRKETHDVEEKQLIKLSDCIQVTAEIMCDGCKNTHITDNEFFAEEEFYNLGWRVISGKCLCPSCIIKVK